MSVVYLSWPTDGERLRGQTNRRLFNAMSTHCPRLTSRAPEGRNSGIMYTMVALASKNLDWMLVARWDEVTAPASACLLWACGRPILIPAAITAFTCVDYG